MDFPRSPQIAELAMALCRALAGGGRGLPADGPHYWEAEHWHDSESDEMLFKFAWD